MKVTSLDSKLSGLKQLFLVKFRKMNGFLVISIEM